MPRHLLHNPHLRLRAQDIASALYVSLLGGAASYGIFFWLASSKGNLTALSSLTFLTPVRVHARRGGGGREINKTSTSKNSANPFLHPLSHISLLHAQVFAAAAGYLALGEVLTLPQILGGTVTLSAVFLISGSKDKQKASSSP